MWFSDGTNFNTSAAGTAVKKVLQKYIKKVFGSDANLTDAQTCYYLYGERIANGTNQQFHPGVDINYYEALLFMPFTVVLLCIPEGLTVR